MTVRYGQTVTDGQKNHLEISDSETSETMCHLAPTLFFFFILYVVPQKYMINQAAEIKEIHKMSVRNDFSKIY